MHRLSERLGGRFAFGGDYNPEQWPEDVWREDVALMQRAGVNLVSVGIFSWALLEPAEGVYEFGWLDRVLDLLHASGISVDLATATASPPPWFSHTYPDTLPVDSHGVRRSFGARQAYCPSSPRYRKAAADLAGRIASRYAEHPAVVLWHVNNEYGCHNWHCYCEVSADAFRAWLRARHGSIDALNESWGTAFWSQHYTDWQQVGPPRAVSYNSFANPGQQLDWWRFGSDELLGCYRAEADAVRAVASQPVTTNFMSYFKPVDYRSWTSSLDVISNDHYLLAEDPDNAQELAMAADLMRSLAQGQPWLLMEHSPSAVNWQPRNIAKAPGELRRNSLSHVARGADGALFFQWRAARAGAEKFHSALLPHAGTDTSVWREVEQLGADLQSIAEIVGVPCEPARAALLFDWTSWWAATLDSHPSTDIDPQAELRRWHTAFWERNVAVDVVGPADDLDAYSLIVVPVQYLLDDAASAALIAAATRGAAVVVTFFSGIVDEHDHIRLGGYPGALRDLLGIRIEEFFPLRENEQIDTGRYGPGRIWSELGRIDSADVLGAYGSGPVAGAPAVTRRTVDAGSAWYVGTSLAHEGLGTLVDDLLAAASVAPSVAGLPRGVEAVRRRSPDTSYVFLLNHTDADVAVPVSGTDLLTGVAAVNELVLPAGGSAVVREV